MSPFQSLCVPALRRVSVVALSFFALAAFSAPARADCCLADLENGFDPADGNPVAYELDFQGDVSSIIPAQVTDDPFINPWAALNHLSGNAVNPTTVTYDSAANLTRVTMSGDPLPMSNPAGSGNPGYVLGTDVTYHTGLNQGWDYSHPGCVTPPVAGEVCLVSRHWNYADSSTQELNALSVNWDGKFKKKGKGLRWLLTFIGTANVQTGQEQAGAWKLTAWDPAGRAKFIVTNASHTPITIDRIGYETDVSVPTDPACQQSPRCDGNEEALEQLNYEAYPPPGDKGSRFIKLAIPRTLKPGKSYKFLID